MSKGQRLKNIIIGILMLPVTFLVVYVPEDGVYIASLIVALSLFVFSVRYLIYYFTMARFMVGGKPVLYKAVIYLNISLFALSLDDLPRKYVMLYLLAIHAFDGAVELLRAGEMKKLGSKAWLWKLAEGVANLGLALVGLFFKNSLRLFVYIYGAGLAYSALVRIAGSFRKEKSEYYQ